MAAYTTPGIYYETVDATDAHVSSVRTDVAGFVGIAERGPVDTPVPLESWRQFRAHFGEVIGSGYLAYAVRAFFENGGLRCWVVRVASRDPLAGVASASAMLASSAGATPPVWRVRASSPGSWGNALAIQLAETHRAQTTGVFAPNAPAFTTVASTSGFTRGTLVRLTQSAATPPIYRVVNEVDATERRLWWTTDRPARRMVYDSILSGLDASQPVMLESVEYTIIVARSGLTVAAHEGLSLIPEHPAYGPRLLAPPRGAFDGSAGRTSSAAPYVIAIDELRDDFGADPAIPRPSLLTVGASVLPSPVTVPLEGGLDGLRLLAPSDFTGAEWAPDDSDIVKASCRRGFRALSLVDEISLVAVPDIHIHPIAPPEFAPLPPCVPDPCLFDAVTPVVEPPQRVHELPPVFEEEDVFRVQLDLVEHCEARRDRIALLDPPFDTAHNVSLGIAGIRAWRQRFDSNMAALYHPWVRVVDPLRTRREPTRAVPPSGHVAGQIARTDRTVGVHKAPANDALAWAHDLTFAVDDESHGLLNTLGINVMRALPGRGIRILGARTVSSDSMWRFLPVRRLVLMVMKALDRATQWAVFEPNDAGTRERLRLSILIYLATLWQQGQLAGSSMEEAFVVRCDDTNNPPADVALGNLCVDVGIAPAIPFEFVVVRVWRSRNELEITERTLELDGVLV